MDISYTYAYYTPMVFWTSFSLLMIFLISAMYFANSMLEIMGINKLCHLPPSFISNIWFITTVDGDGWWWMVADFSNSLKIIESIVTVMTLLQHQRGQFTFTIIKILQSNSVVFLKYD